MSDACKTRSCDRRSFKQADRCGCGAGLTTFQLKVVHAETGELVTKFCRRCAVDLVGLPAAANAGQEGASTQ